MKHYCHLLFLSVLPVLASSCGSFGEGMLMGLSGAYAPAAYTPAPSFIPSSTVPDANTFFNQQMQQASSQVQAIQAAAVQNWQNQTMNGTMVNYNNYVPDNSTYVPTYVPSSGSGSDYWSEENRQARKNEIYRTTVGENCPLCKGSGKCHACNGTKVASGLGQTYTCTVCGPDGLCPHCHGSGKNPLIR